MFRRDESACPAMTACRVHEFFESIEFIALETPILKVSDEFGPTTMIHMTDRC